MDQKAIEKLAPWFEAQEVLAARIVTSGPVCWFVRSVLKQGAMTIAPFVFFGRHRFDPASASSLALLAHELEHLRQYRRLGRLRFLGTYLRDRLRAGSYSRELPLEAEPYRLQDEVKAALLQSAGE